jgi:hypothetical protein
MIELFEETYIEQGIGIEMEGLQRQVGELGCTYKHLLQLLDSSEEDRFLNM